MKITQVTIQNYRSIKHLTFSPSNICALVGENNAGKTNILSALSFLLGEIWPTRRSLEASDYFNQNTDLPIHIEVRFERNPTNIKRIWCTIPWEGASETKCEYFPSGVYNLNTESREQCALVYLDANRNLEYHLGHSRWTLFGRIIRQLDSDFRANSTAQQQAALIASFNQARDLLRTDLCREFEQELTSAFNEQIKRTIHRIELEFKTFDPLNYYRSIHALLIENGISKNPSEAGQGMRNLILLALFRTYAKVFKGDAIIAVEEPEIYLHPHAQRSLSALFQDLAGNGSQVFYSTHSGNFIHSDLFDQICLVEKFNDDDGDECTQIRQVTSQELLQARHRLYPSVHFTEAGLRERYRNICNLEHNEAFFAKKIILVEGETEAYSLPLYSLAIGYDLDCNGISIVNAHGKNNLDQFYQLYTAFIFPTYVIFDNDLGVRDAYVGDFRANEILLQMLGQPLSREPIGIVTDHYAILNGNFEEEMRSELNKIETGLYESIRDEAAEQLGPRAGKGLLARFMAQRLITLDIIPNFIRNILDEVQRLGIPTDQTKPEESLTIEDEIPF